ncbi:hypothetical protein [Nitratireductor soli]|uniref:hypothetical protein n=1 Tax=Nitratireductor soli TaxID=1670619 RepID=UPI00065E6F37|nr:hypothetical protein [Nitratireductor soli]
MEMKQAVVEAKTVILDLYADEGIDEIGLEEVEFDPAEAIWNITIGFRRPWSRSARSESKFVSAMFSSYGERWYKTVRISDVDRKLLSVKDRILKDAA